MSVEKTKIKWFWPAQEIARKWLKENSDDYSCNWQCIDKGIVTECYLIQKGEGIPEAVLFVYYRNTKIVMLFNANKNFGMKF